MSVLPAAYGLRFAGIPDTPWLALEGAERWPCIAVALIGEQEAQLDLDAMSVRFPAEIEPGELIHPLLARLAVRVGIERGLDAIHAGAVAGAEGAWAIVGHKEAGKSTLLAACHAAGMTVLADDTVVMDGERCLSGPRCIDLREPAARRSAAATVRVRPETARERLTLPPAAAEQPLAGIVHLAWSDDSPALEPLPASDAVRRLLEHQQETAFPRDPFRILDLAQLPNVELRRPPRWEDLAATADLLGERIGAAEPPSSASGGPAPLRMAPPDRF